ncbi:MAG: DUF3108 domain-containing protein [Pseudomonadota bacterium]
MANPSLPAASPIYRPRRFAKCTAYLAFALALMTAWARADGNEETTTVETKAQEAVEILPYTAEYEFEMAGLTIKVKRELKQRQDGEWVLTFAGKKLVASIQETAVFSVHGEAIQPRSFVYQLNAGLVKRRREVHFDGSDVIRSLYKDKWYELPYTEGTLDRMTQQEQLRFSLIADPTPKEDVNVRIADGKRIKEYILRYAGEELVKTPLGEVNTLRFTRVHDDDEERSSDFWVAPDWDYLMVKTLHVEDGSANEAVITGATIGGKKL